MSFQPHLTREELHSRLTKMVARVLAQPEELTAASLVEEIEAEVAEFGVQAAEVSFQATLGPEMGRAVFKDITSTAGVSNADLVEGKLSRAAVSKMCCRVRRFMGLPLRQPNNARAGRKPKAPQPL